MGYSSVYLRAPLASPRLWAVSISAATCYLRVPQRELLLLVGSR